MTVVSQRLVTPTHLGQLLRSARKSLNLTQAQLAERVDLSQRRISELELEPGSLSVDQLMALCNQLGLEVVVQAKDAESKAPSREKGEW